MIGNFKLARKITFLLPLYSSMPMTFYDVYYDRFNSIFKGFYLIIPEENTTNGALGRMSTVLLKKLNSSDCFGSRDIIEVDRVPEYQLTIEQKATIRYLNYCIQDNKYQTVE